MNTTAVPIPSKKKVQKAGKVLAKNTATDDEFNQAMGILSQWRSLHNCPINTFQDVLKSNLERLGFESPIIAQRLKRTPSIIRKLQRFPHMSLAKMQDIGGIRVVLSNVDEIYRIHDDTISTFGSSKHEPLPPHDYIKEPKLDGYRSIHQVFKYKSEECPELNGLQIELQIRTKLQHSWATAVETLGIIEKSSFKTGEGDKDFKRFFQLASALFSHKENCLITPALADRDITDIAGELVTLENDLQIFVKLAGLIVTAKHIETTSNDSDEYHLMELDTSTIEPAMSLTPFTKSQLGRAENFYRMREIQNKDNPNIELVLISAGNLKDIQKAYPNYFLDTQDFIMNLNDICSKILA